MKFIDECVIKLFSGNGGDGHVDFVKGSNIADGGSGGKGGSIYFEALNTVNTLLNISSKKEYHAQNGNKGKYQNSKGKNGDDLILKVPIGTKVYFNNNLIAKLKENDKLLVAEGGKGGRGNKLYNPNNSKEKNYNFEKGEVKDFLTYKLSLEVLADIGFVGKPSAGKSTILSIISNANPKIAEYDFTTLKPQLGLVKVSKNKSFVAVDLPGLIASFSNKNYVSKDTLKTISKCRAIAHVIDFGTENKDPIKDFEIIKNEIKKYSLNLLSLPTIIIANKMDQECFYEKLKKFRKVNPSQEIIKISALKQKNIKELKYKLFNMIINK